MTTPIEEAIERLSVQVGAAPTVGDSLSVVRNSDLRALLSRVSEVDCSLRVWGWQPIATAPRHGQRIIGRDAEGDIFGLEWEHESADEGYWVSPCGQPVVQAPQPVQWMPVTPQSIPTPTLLERDLAQTALEAVLAAWEADDISLNRTLVALIRDALSTPRQAVGAEDETERLRLALEKAYSGEEWRGKVTFLLEGGQFGLPKGYVIMSLEALSTVEAQGGEPGICGETGKRCSPRDDNCAIDCLGRPSSRPKAALAKPVTQGEEGRRECPLCYGSGHTLSKTICPGCNGAGHVAPTPAVLPEGIREAVGRHIEIAMKAGSATLTTRWAMERDKAAASILALLAAPSVEGGDDQ